MHSHSTSSSDLHRHPSPERPTGLVPSLTAFAGKTPELPIDLDESGRTFGGRGRVIALICAEALNALSPPGHQLPYDERVPAAVVVVDQALPLARVHQRANQRRRWVTLPEEAQGSPVTMRDRMALPQAPTHISDVTVQPGSVVVVSYAGANAFGRGGARQIELERPDAATFGSMRRLG